MAEPSVSLWTPILYVTVLFAALVTFSKVNQKRKLQKLASTKQFYEYNFAKEAYQQLKDKPNVPQKVMEAALITWGVENFTRLLKYRENEPIFAALLQKGEVGDETYERFTGSKELNERELQEILMEAKVAYPKWDTFMATVQEVAQQNAVRRRINNIDELKAEYRALLPSNVKDSAEK